jgi:hypothetical protein
MKKRKRQISQSDLIGYVYLIESPIGYKIGKTKSIHDRAAIFNVKLPFEWRFKKTFLTPYYHALEKYLHEYFNKVKINGEWFDLNENQVEEFDEVCNAFKIMVTANLKMVKGVTYDVSGTSTAIVVWPDINNKIQEYCIKVCSDGSLEIFSSYVEEDLIVDIENHIIRVYHKKDAENFDIDSSYPSFVDKFEIPNA